MEKYGNIRDIINWMLETLGNVVMILCGLITIPFGMYQLSEALWNNFINNQVMNLQFYLIIDGLMILNGCLCIFYARKFVKKCYKKLKKLTLNY